MKNRSLILFIFILSLSAILIFLVLNYKNKKPKTSPPPDFQEMALIDSAEVAPINYRSQYIAEKLIRGYIQAYDWDQQSLKIAYQLNPRAKEQLISYPLTLDQTVYCWPRYNNGIDISQAFMPIDPQSLIYVKDEQAVFFESVAKQIIGKYVFLQIDEQQELLKLAIVACYD